MDLVNEYGNNNSFVSLPSTNPFTARARALYGSTQTHGANSVVINTDEISHSSNRARMERSLKAVAPACSPHPGR